MTVQGFECQGSRIDKHWYSANPRTLNPFLWHYGSVLVTDGHWRKTLAVVRSLGRKGVHVTVGERTFLNTSFFSKHCSRRIVYPSPRRYPDQFIEFILKEIKKKHYDCLFPMEEETLLLLAKHQSEVSRYTYLLIPDLTRSSSFVIREN